MKTQSVPKFMKNDTPFLFSSFKWRTLDRLEVHRRLVKRFLVCQSAYHRPIATLHLAVPELESNANICFLVVDTFEGYAGVLLPFLYYSRDLRLSSWRASINSVEEAICYALGWQGVKLK